MLLSDNLNLGGIVNFFSKISSYFAGLGQLPPVPPVKAPNRQQSLASYKTQVARATSPLQKADLNLSRTDLLDFRSGQSTWEVVRNLAAASPDLAGTLNAFLRTGIPETYTVISRDLDGAINVESTKLAQEILRRITFLGDPTLGYNSSSDIQSLSESLGKELILYGSAALELVLNKARVPSYLNAVSVTKLKFMEDSDGGVSVIQELGGQTIKLDIPTFFLVSIDQSLLTPYSSSMFESAIQAVLADAAFLNDLRKSMQRVIQPRLIATIVEEKVKASIPPDILNDSDKLATFYNTLIAELQSTMSGLNAEDALVGFDSVNYSLLSSQGSATNIADTLSTVQKLLESKLAAGAKTLPAVLGRDANGSAATTSSMLFLKNADVLRRKLNVLYSRALTQAVRLLGQDTTVEFRFDDLDLRPQGELEAYKSMKQSRILEQLSIGLISDEEAAIQLTGNLPREGATPLAGTFFKSNTANSQNPTSQTSNMGKQNGVTGKPDTPAAPKADINRDKMLADAGILTFTSSYLKKSYDLEDSDFAVPQAQAPEPAPLPPQHIVNLTSPLAVHIPQPIVNIASTQVTVEPTQVHVAPAQVNVEAAQIQVDVHPAEVHVSPTPITMAVSPTPITVKVAPTPVTINNDVKPSEVVVNNTHPAKAVQTVQRDSKQEILSTTTTYET